jgi:hypothetical protein
MGQHFGVVLNVATLGPFQFLGRFLDLKMPLRKFIRDAPVDSDNLEIILSGNGADFVTQLDQALDKNMVGSYVAQRGS